MIRNCFSVLQRCSLDAESQPDQPCRIIVPRSVANGVRSHRLPNVAYGAGDRHVPCGSQTMDDARRGR